KDANGTALSGRVVTWATSNAAAATASANGLVTGVATGSATIIATSEGQSGTSALTVANAPVASVTVSPAAATVTVGTTTQLTATPKDANGTALGGRAVTWATSNAAIATVSASGLVTGVAAGSATITATSEGQSGTSAITVTNVPVASVMVSPTAAGLTVGATMQLAATPKDANGTALSGRDGLGERLGDGCGGRLGHDHRDERGAERDIRHDGDERTGGLSDGEPRCREPDSGADDAARRRDQGRERHRPQWSNRDLDDEQ